MLVGDDDCDGFTSSDETAIGTNPNVPCGPNAWPPDFDDSQVMDILDVLALKPVFGTPSVRHDLNVSGGGIDIIDVLALKPFFGESCAL